jgi:hypothetical protein
MRRKLKQYLPDHESIRSNRWLAVFGDTLLHPRLWHLNRHSAAGAVAVGLFCGLIPGPLQMFGATILCIVLRVNLPLALFATFYTNPLTIVPLYFVAYSLGALVLPGNGGEFVAPPDWEDQGFGVWLGQIGDWMQALGKPLLLGVPLLASILAIVGYFAVRAAWRWYLIRAWRNRHGKRRRSA